MSDGVAVSAEVFGKLADSARCRPLPHGADQDDDGAQVDLWAKEANRRGRYSLPANVTIAAEAVSLTPCGSGSWGGCPSPSRT